MDDIKRCSKCKVDCLKTDFHENTNSKDGLHSYCIACRKENGKNII